MFCFVLCRILFIGMAGTVMGIFRMTQDHRKPCQTEESKL